MEPHDDILNHSAESVEDLGWWKFMLIRVRERRQAIGELESVFNAAGPISSWLEIAAGCDLL